MDKIIIKGLEVFAYHGVNDFEKNDGQKFIIDITVKANLKKSCSSDDINDTVSYAKILKLAVKILKGKSCNLLEFLSQEVARAIILEFNEIKSVKVKIMKPDAPIKAKFLYTAVSIKRKRKDYTNE